MDIIKLLPLPPGLEQLLNSTLSQLPTLTDTLTVIFDRVPIADNQWLFYITLFFAVYLVITVALSTVRWVLSLFTFAIKVCIVVGIFVALFWLTQEDNQFDRFVFQNTPLSAIKNKYGAPLSTAPPS
ncbi:hypothetical protein BDF19DRAFT_435193 [Syncephalis fuscata]|nr:hypothetical protein BDF19DRAFT_435193 [Syncephalis fuscata]